MDEPAEWCARMVVVPKANGKVQIFIYLTKLNKSILREYHSLPSVDHTFAQLAGVTISIKLDANSGFWQIGLSPESAKLKLSSYPSAGFVLIAYHLESVQPLNISRTDLAGS